MSRLLIKLSSVLVIAFGAINIFIFMGVHFLIPYPILMDNFNYYVLLLIITMISFISLVGGICFNHYNELSDEEFRNKRNCILCWSFIFFICSPITSIITLVAYIFIDEKISYTNKTVYVGYIEELKKLEKLKDEGYITEEEFTRKKRKILDI